MKPAIILCSRYGSSRVPGKAFRKINGVPVIHHLINRLKKTGLDIIVAVPQDDLYHYNKIDGVKFFTGYADDPMARMYHAAREYGIDTIVRVTHDKVLVEPRLILSALKQFNSDYLFSSEFTDGSAFEIISFNALRNACMRFHNVEFISYAIKAVAEKTQDFRVAGCYKSHHRLLIDYDKDLTLLESVFLELGNDCSLEQVIKFMDRSRWAKHINRLPVVSIYTCVYNGSKYLDRCISSVIEQDIFKRCEFIVVDDFSSDDSYLKAVKALWKFKNVKIIRNQENLGLASSSNVALKNSQGKFIVRLDADDYFVNKRSVSTLLKEIVATKKDVIYPDNYFGSFDVVQSGKENHHVGGAMFRIKAVNHVKFTEGLRGFEGLEFFERARKQIDVGYLRDPIFFYRQHDESLTKNNIEERAELRSKIESGVLGDRLT